MTRPCGRALCGERRIDTSPHGHRKTSPLIATLGVEGVRCSTLVDGAVNADVFEAFVEQVPDLPEPVRAGSNAMVRVATGG